MSAAGKPKTIFPHELPTAAIHGLYVHVPFCAHKCHYCDFYSITRQSPERMERFVELVWAEAELWAEAAAQPTTVFFGGGTPTLLPAAALERLIVGLRQRIDCNAVGEWTVEANPLTVNEEYCARLRAAGVDRLSFGAQSFHAAELAMLERDHAPDGVESSVAAARAAGFARLNVDLIYAIPGQTQASWDVSLSRALALETGHVSCYGLTYEANTAMTVRKRLGQFSAAAEETELAMMYAARRKLAEAGLRAYEISNYAAPGQECRHNLMYWSGGNYVGLGPAAASHVEGVRWRNRPHLGEWERALAEGALPACEGEKLDARGRAGELAMLGLRLERGVDFADFEARTGFDARQLWAQELRSLEGLGLIAVRSGGFALTDAGLRVADAVAQEFLAV